MRTSPDVKLENVGVGAEPVGEFVFCGEHRPG